MYDQNETAYKMAITCSPFSTEHSSKYSVIVYPDNVIKVWSILLGRYTSLHRLKGREAARIVKDVRKYGEPINL